MFLAPVYTLSRFDLCRRRFQKHFKGEVREYMQEKYPFLRDEKNMLAFERKWQYMFPYAEVGYARAYTSLHHFTFTRPVSLSNDQWGSIANGDLMIGECASRMCLRKVGLGVRLLW